MDILRKRIEKILEDFKNGVTDEETYKKEFDKTVSSIIDFNMTHGDFPTVEITRNGKTLIQQRSTKEDLFNHINDKYPDWEIINCNV